MKIQSTLTMLAVLLLLLGIALHAAGYIIGSPFEKREAYDYTNWDGKREPDLETIDYHPMGTEGSWLMIAGGTLEFAAFITLAFQYTRTREEIQRNP